MECTYGQQNGQYALKLERFIASPEIPAGEPAMEKKWLTKWKTWKTPRLKTTARSARTIGLQRWPSKLNRGITCPACRHFPLISAAMGNTGMMNELDMILDIPVRLQLNSVAPRSRSRTFLQLAHGSVVELDAMAGEPMDVLVNGTLIAQGEVVVVNDKFGIRLTDIITPSERMRKLNR
jgi:flagellar motor switch protein FliN